MIKVIRIYEDVMTVEKNEYSSTVKKAALNWPDQPIIVDTRVEKKQLIVSLNLREIDFMDKSIGGIIFFENKNQKWLDFTLFKKQMKNWKTDQFSIHQLPSDELELHLNSARQKYSMTAPSRENHKLSNLVVNIPILYKLNNKHNSNGNSSSQRTFTERNYIIQYLGEVDEMKVQSNKDKCEINLDKMKVINERKFLY